MPDRSDADTTAEPMGVEQVTTAEGRRSGERVSPPRTGRHERYELGELLGRGGMGEVYLARDRVLGRDVAIKRLLDELSTEQLEARFVREARVQSKLDHPSIPPVHELATDDAGRPFIVMKRLAGTVLADVLAKPSAAFTRERLLRAFVDVCLALEYAHARGVIHRDLKPANIMLGEFGEVYVLDWGVAKLVEDSDVEIDTIARDATQTQTGSIVGTRAYMAPEQRQGGSGEVDARSDVFALGCILYEILARKPFYKRANLSDHLPSREAQGGDIPPELDELTARATADDRSTRIPTARELGDRVQSYLDGDRDLAARRALAERHLAAALVKLDARDETSRAEALREAGRALALDPSQVAAADVVHRIMVEPPSAMPAEVEASIAAVVARKAADNGRRVVAANCAHLVGCAILLAVGVRDVAYIAAYGAIAVVLIVFAMLGWKEQLSATVRRAVVVLGNAAIVAMYSLFTTPFLVTPTIAMTVVFLGLRSPAFHGRWAFYLVATQTLALLVPLALELTGVLAPSIAIAGNDIVLHSRVLVLHELPTLVALAVVTGFAPVLAAAVSIGHETARLANERLLLVQKWRLEQLVPERDAR